MARVKKTKNGNGMIVVGGEQCKACKFMKPIDGDNNYLMCEFKQKKLFYGQYIPCDGFKKGK